MGTGESVVGCPGTVIVATRGERGPGEVLVQMGGGTEAFLAWSERPLEKGTEIVVFNSRGGRTVDVVELNAST